MLVFVVLIWFTMIRSGRTFSVFWTSDPKKSRRACGRGEGSGAAEEAHQETEVNSSARRRERAPSDSSIRRSTRERSHRAGEGALRRPKGSGSLPPRSSRSRSSRCARGRTCDMMWAKLAVQRHRSLLEREIDASAPRTSSTARGADIDDGQDNHRTALRARGIRRWRRHTGSSCWSDALIRPRPWCTIAPLQACSGNPRVTV